MHFPSVSIVSLAALAAPCVRAAPAAKESTAYAPVTVACPSTPLIRQANGISAAERQYVTERYVKASSALGLWLKHIDAHFDTQWPDCAGTWPPLHPQDGRDRAPVIALTSSGGGYRAQLTGGGVVKSFDDREHSRTRVSGLYQALTYHAGLSGGSWLLSSIAGNDFPTISTLETQIWEPSLDVSLIQSTTLLSKAKKPVYDTVLAEVQSKYAAGFPRSIIDPWGRLLSYGLLFGQDGGVKDTLSGIAKGSTFQCHDAPYPIITALGSDNNINGVCIPQPNATQYEFHPFEFGSWDDGVGAFVESKYLGTSFSQGYPTGSCVTHFDQLGYVLGTSSNVFAAVCGAVPANDSMSDNTLGLIENLAELIAPGAPGVPEQDIFALYPNPFYQLPSSPHVAGVPLLELVDGGVGVQFQGNPIWPFLHRHTDVLVVNDNLADTAQNFPNGSEIYNTYLAAKSAGLTRMPTIPTPDTFVAEKLNQRPTFFGCNDDHTVTIIYIPNYNYTYPSGQPTVKVQYFVNETRGMVANGVQIGNEGGKEGWPLCLACGTVKKTSRHLPEGCDACFKEYCYN